MPRKWHLRKADGREEMSHADTGGEGSRWNEQPVQTFEVEET